MLSIFLVKCSDGCSDIVQQQIKFLSWPVSAQTCHCNSRDPIFRERSMGNLTRRDGLAGSCRRSTCRARDSLIAERRCCSSSTQAQAWHWGLGKNDKKRLREPKKRRESVVREKVDHFIVVCSLVLGYEHVPPECTLTYLWSRLFLRDRKCMRNWNIHSRTLEHGENTGTMTRYPFGNSWNFPIPQERMIHQASDGVLIALIWNLQGLGNMVK